MRLPLTSCVGLVGSVGQPCVERHHHRNGQTSQVLIIKLYYQWPLSVRWKTWTGWNLPSSRRRTKSRCRLCRGMIISGPGTQKMTLTIQLKLDCVYELFFFLHLALFCSTHELTNGSHEDIILISIGLPSLLKIWKIWSLHVKLVSDNIIFQHTYQDSRSRLYQPEQKMNGIISHQLQLTTDILGEK